MVQAWVNDPASNFGLILLDGANTDGLAFSSKESSTASQRPRLEVTYVPAISAKVSTPADSVIDGGENPLTLQEALEGSAPPSSGGGSGNCGALGLEPLLLLALVRRFRGPATLFTRSANWRRTGRAPRLPTGS
jgi:hypothetical protein